jgi:hypothetical protein
LSAFVTCASIAVASLDPMPGGVLSSGTTKCAKCGDAFSCKNLPCGIVAGVTYGPLNVQLMSKFTKINEWLYWCKPASAPAGQPQPKCPYSPKKCGVWTYHLGTCSAPPFNGNILGTNYGSFDGYQTSCK